MLSIRSSGLEHCKLPEKVLSKDEQQTKVNEMVEKGQTHQAEAAKKIEGK